MTDGRLWRLTGNVGLLTYARNGRFGDTEKHETTRTTRNDTKLPNVCSTFRRFSPFFGPWRETSNVCSVGSFGRGRVEHVEKRPAERVAVVVVRTVVGRVRRARRDGRTVDPSSTSSTSSTDGRRTRRDGHHVEHVGTVPDGHHVGHRRARRHHGSTTSAVAVLRCRTRPQYRPTTTDDRRRPRWPWS